MFIGSALLNSEDHLAQNDTPNWYVDTSV